MKSWIKIGVGCFFLYIAFLIATIPANFVISKVKLPANVALGNVSGTLWQGKLDTLTVDGILLKNVGWSIALPKLLSGEVGADFKFGSSRKILEPFGQGYAYFAGAQNIGLANTQLSIPADIAMPKLKQIRGNMVESLQGIVKADIQAASIGKPYCTELAGKVNWQQSALGVMGGQFSLGDLNVDLACDKGNLLASVKGDDKTLLLDLKAELKDKNQTKVDGFVKAGPSADAMLMNAMTFLGKADSQGRYKIKFGR
ncbi:hypothetical protein C2869_20790 [Saccharobesus litoralis]|uniref:Type II secretion system protein N n=1 Tax=Saccharobesus litoralis TaxID=2172099 RepID=A0A2S0VWY2_9ALTE|nr:type II secretion system protein N [Saccharobesus litoralis]AWB68682.1 hypothetical protein C2869_20790 [Saccharobesus litoralis]